MKTLVAAVSILAAFIALVAIVFLVIGRERSWVLIAGQPDRGRLDFNTLKRSPTANDALACTTGLHDGCDFELASYDTTPADLAGRIARQVEKTDPLARRVDDGSSPEHLRFVTHSPNMRFPDLVNIEIVEMDGGGLGIMAYARAQLGRIDFGANRARLKRYFDGL